MNQLIERMMLKANTANPISTLNTFVDTIDCKLAQSVLDRLGYTLQDLSLEYGDVVIPNGDISHQLYYSSNYNDCNLLGYVWTNNGIYYVSNYIGNFKTPEQAALKLLDPQTVADMCFAIQVDRWVARDYD